MEGVQSSHDSDYEEIAGTEQSNSSTPATSVSTSGIDISPLCREKDHKDEATSFLADLDNYLALGCIVIPRHLEPKFGQDLEAANSWREVHSLKLALTVHVQKLLRERLIRMFCHISDNLEFIICRIYLLPHDVGRRFTDWSGKTVRSALDHLLSDIDTSPSTWSGFYEGTKKEPFDLWPAAEDCSLFYMFNTLPSPSPSPEAIRNRYSRAAVYDILDPEYRLNGLKTVLYPFQRRAAAAMLEREASSKLLLDPRLEPRVTPTGEQYYYDWRAFKIYKNPRYFESLRGGILAETMGLGKTVIALALILASKGHYPKVPAEYLPECLPVRPSVGRLVDMAVSAAARYSIPWRPYFDMIRAYTGEDMTQCISELESAPLRYKVPMEVPAKQTRHRGLVSLAPQYHERTLCSGTIIVVPRNLITQWQSELKKHVDIGALNVLVMDDPREHLPSVSELLHYDVILFSRTRFEREANNRRDEIRRRAPEHPSEILCQCTTTGGSSKLDCSCSSSCDMYESPLKSIHWLRIIIDEGHNLANANTNIVSVADKLVYADRRWVITGTPMRDLVGVEVDLAATADEESVLDPQTLRDQSLEQRKNFSYRDDQKAVQSLGSLVAHFLKMRPWAGTVLEKSAEWHDYIYRHNSRARHTFSGFSSCLRSTLEGVVIKTRPEDVERDIVLPPLVHRVVYLEPSYYDRLTANLFCLVLTSNAVTSERTDADYLFHKNNGKALYALVSNLRQSNFFWTGFSEADVHAALGNSRRYLAKEGTRCSEEDRQLLSDCIQSVETVLVSQRWKMLAKSHEIGLFLDHWPEGSAGAWGFGDDSAPLLIGVTQLLQAQAHVNNGLSASDPAEGLAMLAKTAIGAIFENSDPKDERISLDADRSPLMKMGLPASAVEGELPLGKRRLTNGSGPSLKRQKMNPASSNRKPESVPSRSRKSLLGLLGQVAVTEDLDLPPESPLRRTTIIGTTSSKFSHVIDKVLTHHNQEKILIFYDGDNTAYYIAQALELLDVRHRIYARTLSNELRAKYVLEFDTDESIRVLLMDVKCGALGLNLNAASRVIFINPVFRPNIEAQAIKRAHRIGQVRPVEVETLVLKGSIEEAMFERARAMSRQDHLEAAKALEEDRKIASIIQQARPVLVNKEDGSGYAQVAPLEKPQQLFGRPNRGHALFQDPLSKLRNTVGPKQPTRTCQASMREANSTQDGPRMEVSVSDQAAPEGVVGLSAYDGPSLFGGDAGS